MSNYSDPNFNQDFAQGYTDPGAGYGDFAQGYDFNAGYEQAAPDGEVVYGDEGPMEGTSGDDAYAQSYQQEAAPDDQQADAEPSGYDQTGYDQAGYDQAGYDQAGYDQTGYDQGYAADYNQGYDEAGYAQDDEQADYQDEAPEDDEAPAGDNKRKMIVAATAGLAVLALLGGGSYFLLTSSDESGSPGFDLGSITRMIPFLGPKDSEANILMGQDNATTVKLAIDAYAREHGKFPPTASALMAQLRAMHKDLKNPYNLEEPLVVEAGSAPSAPGVVAYAVEGKTYTIVVGDITGQPLAIDGQLFEVTGRLVAAKPPQPTPAKPGAKPGAKPAPAKPPQVAKLPADAAPDTAPIPPAKAPTGKQTPEPKDDSLAGYVSERQAPKPENVGKVVPPDVVVRRNQEFDRWRSRGIALVYEQRTAESIAAFKRALALRPGDPSVTRWLNTIQSVIDKHVSEERSRFEQERATLLKDLPTPPPARIDAPAAPAPVDDARKMYDELKKQDKAPLLAPPKLDD